MFHSQKSPALEHGGKKAVDDLVEHDLPRALRVKVPHLPGHLYEEHVSGGLAAEDWPGVSDKEGRVHVLALDEDRRDLGLNGAHKEYGLSLVHSLLRQLPDGQPPHVCPGKILILESHLDVRSLGRGVVLIDLHHVVSDAVPAISGVGQVPEQATPDGPSSCRRRRQYA